MRLRGAMFHKFEQQIHFLFITALEFSFFELSFEFVDLLQASANTITLCFRTKPLFIHLRNPIRLWNPITLLTDEANLLFHIRVPRSEKWFLADAATISRTLLAVKWSGASLLLYFDSECGINVERREKTQQGGLLTFVLLGQKKKKKQITASYEQI